MARDHYDSDEEYQQAIADELEILDYYQEKRILGAQSSTLVKYPQCSSFTNWLNHLAG